MESVVGFGAVQEKALAIQRGQNMNEKRVEDLVEELRKLLRKFEEDNNHEEEVDEALKRIMREEYDAKFLDNGDPEDAGTDLEPNDDPDTDASGNPKPNDNDDSGFNKGP